VKTERLFISIYVVYVLIVLVADVYHRAVMVPRIRHEMEMREHHRQIEAARVASERAGDAWGDLAGGGGGVGGSDGVGGVDDDRDSDAASIATEGGGRRASWSGGGGADRAVDVRTPRGGGDGADRHPWWGDDDARTHASAPPLLEDAPMGCSTPIIKNRALNAVLTALSNYNDVEHDFDDVDFDGGGGGGEAGSDASSSGRRRRHDGWGVESTIEGSRPWDRPVVLHGADGVLTRHPHHHPRLDGTENEDGGGMDQYSSPYRVMEDMDIVERMCVHDGSTGHPARGWVAAWHDARQELAVHFRECWGDIVDDEESSGLDKFLMVCEYPLTVARKVRALLKMLLNAKLLFIFLLAWTHSQSSTLDAYVLVLYIRALS
jgi:sodium/potassium/calcium exchanger 6